MPEPDHVDRILAEVCPPLGVTAPAVPRRATDEALLWAQSGAMALTGSPDGTPRHTSGAPALLVQGALDILAACAPGAELPDVGLLGERAAITGRRRAAPWSVGRAFQALPTCDGWLGISLARASDRELIPALTETEPASIGAACGVPAAGEWEHLARWLRGISTVDALARAVLLGLPAAAVPVDPSVAPAPRRSSVVVTQGGTSRVRRARPLVVDLSGLWAGPLCGHLLGLAGARVIKVESVARPDGARSGAPEFFDLLHAGHESVAVDLRRDRALLDALLDQADVVIEASRPRALRQLGVRADEHVARGAVWVSITAYGREGEDGTRVGFGDDVAAGAGLVVWAGGRPWPVADAVADPLSGVTAAAAAALALRGPRGCLLDVSMNAVAAAAARPPVAAPAGCGVARPPRRRRPTGRAPRLGEHTTRVAAEFHTARRTVAPPDRSTART